MPKTAQEHMREAPVIRPWRNVERSVRDPYGHKMYLYVQAAPVFEQYGFKGATIKALAHACGLSPSSLYHYFGSKREMAIYPLTSPALDWENTYIDPDLDPLVQLRMMLDMAVAMFPIWTLALRMYEEIQSRPDERMRTEGFRQGEAVFGRLVQAVAPAMERGAAERLARDVLASLAGSTIIALDEDVMTVQQDRMRGVLRSGLVPRSVAADRFDAVMLGPAGEVPESTE